MPLLLDSPIWPRFSVLSPRLPAQGVGQRMAQHRALSQNPTILQAPKVPLLPSDPSLWRHYHKIHYLPLGMQYRDLTLLLLWFKLCTLRIHRVSFLKFKSCCKQKIFQTSFYWIVPFLRPFVIKWMKFEQSREIDYEWKSQSIYWMFALSPSDHYIKELLTLWQMMKKLR